MLSKEGINRYKRVLVEATSCESGWAQKESPSVNTPDPNIDDGAPMEQARPMSHLECASLAARAPKSLEARLELVKAVRLTLKVKPGTQDEIVLLALESYLDLFYVYGFDFSREGIHSLERQVIKSFQVVKQFLKRGEWLSYFKWKNAAFFASWLGQVPPPLPFEAVAGETWQNSRFLFGGAFYRFQSKIFMDANIRNSFALSVLQSKKGMPRPTDQQVRAAEVKSFKTMTSPKAQEQFRYKWEHTTFRPCDDLVPTRVSRYSDNYNPFSRKVTYGRSWMEQQLGRTVTEIFKKDFDCSLAVLTHYFLPSSSANYNNSRSKFGGFGALEEADVMKVLYKRGSVLPFRLKITTLSERVSEYYGSKGYHEQTLDAFNKVSQDVLGVEFDDKEFLPKWKKFYWTVVALAEREEPVCKVVGLKEALKIRCISKGPPLTYFVLKPFQRVMWQQLQTFWNFELTGTPVTEALINKRFGRLGPTYRYHSGDYSAATDELHSWVSNKICDSFFEVVNKQNGYNMNILQTLFTRALTGHIYQDDELGSAAQQRGQLMGSIVSFPVLCIANVTLIRAAYELAHGRVTSIKKLPTWINGDDCLTAYHNTSFPAYWRGLGDVMGFKESVGKCYDSAVFCSINSHFFMQDSQSRFKLIPYVNLGLMEGVDRSTGGAKAGSVKTPVQLGLCQTELINASPNGLKPLVQKLFLYKHFEILKAFQGPLFLPTYCGGAGLKSLVPYTRQELDRVTVARLLIGEGYKVPKESPEKDWALYDNFLSVVRRFCGFSCFYPYRRFSNQNGYGQAFFLITLFSWAQKGIHSLLAKQLKNQTSYSKELLSFNNSVNLFQTMHYKQGWQLLPADPLWVDGESKTEVLPVWVSSSVA